MKKRGFSPMMLGILILAVIVIASVAMFMIANVNNSNDINNENDIDNDSNYLYNNNTSLKQLDRADISKIVYEGEEYDLTKTLRELGVNEFSCLSELTEARIVEYEELKAKAKEKDNGIEDSDAVLGYATGLGLAVYRSGYASQITLKPDAEILGTVYDDDSNWDLVNMRIVNSSNSNKNILDCNISRFSTREKFSFNGLTVGKATKDDVIKKYKDYSINESSFSIGDGGLTVWLYCNDGSSVKFVCEEDSPGTYILSEIIISLEY